MAHEPITEQRPVTDINRGIVNGMRVPPGQLRAMAKSAREAARAAEDSAQWHHNRADIYEDVAAARERGDL